MSVDNNKIIASKTDKKIDIYRKSTCKIMGNIIEIKQMSFCNKKATIRKLNNDEIMILSSGEIINVSHIENRSQNKLQVSQSLKRLRDYINANVTEPKNCKWITLTYAENMTDTKRLYTDFEKFIKKARYNFKEYKIEYIVAMEPQGRGAWHCHLILIFDRVAPYIPNKIISNLWGNGFTKTHKLDNIDNIGAYLTAYLGDIEYTEENLKDCFKHCNTNLLIKEVESIENIKLEKPKKYIKGGRLYMYPPKFNIYRISKGIKKPITYEDSYDNIKIKEGLGEPSYTSSIEYTINDFSNIIHYEQYNRLRKQCQI